MKRLSSVLRWSLLATVLAAPAPADPWWDDFPTFLQTSDPRTAEADALSGAFCGAADDPTWGLYGQQIRIASRSRPDAAFRRAGIRQIAYFEGYGEASTYIAQLKRDDQGNWQKYPGDPSLTRIFAQHWSWSHFDGTGEIHWVGIHNYFDDDDFARPWTRTNPDFASPPMRYPDGRIATGYNGSPDDPRHSRVLDAGCSKDILGRIPFHYAEDVKTNQAVAAGTLAPTGLLRVPGEVTGMPDPGYTPEEWARMKTTGEYSGVFDSGKDPACPFWIDALRASVRRAAQSGADGAWVDNYSPWDNFGSQPMERAFGDWSVATFRDYLRTHFSAAELSGLGVHDVGSFDVRQYLIAQGRAWGGDPGNFRAPAWLDPRWQDDPIWRAYLIHKRQAGTKALTAYDRVAHETAAAAGKPEFLIMGNDIPGYSLGWVRGTLDMVSTELSWGWGLTTGARGLGPPPDGSYVPVYKLAREHARSRFVTAWMYVPPGESGKPNLARVLYYQALANHALPVPQQPANRTAGTPEVNAAFFKFVRDQAPLFGRRLPVEDIGLYYSSSSQLMEMLPGGFRDYADQPHSFAFYGWGTALTELHLPWRAVPEWKLNAATLDALRLLIVPDADVFEKADASVLASWVRGGGAVIITGSSGEREGESGNFARAPEGSTLRELIGDPPGASVAPRAYGRGQVFYLALDPGRPFYTADFSRRPALLDAFRQAVGSLRPGSAFSVDAPDAPATVGLTLYHEPDRLFVDANNTDIDLARDAVTPAPATRFTVTLPPEWRGKKLAARVISPDSPPTVQLDRAGDDRIDVRLGPFPLYASVIIEPAGTPASTNGPP